MVAITTDLQEDLPHCTQVCEVIARNDLILIEDSHFSLVCAILHVDSETKPKMRCKMENLFYYLSFFFSLFLVINVIQFSSLHKLFFKAKSNKNENFQFEKQLKKGN